jgi:hypothetical protein
MEDEQKKQLSQILDQLDQGIESLDLLLPEVLKLVAGDNWSRTWRGDVRKNRFEPAPATLAITASNLIYGIEPFKRLANLMRDASGLPRPKGGK